MKRGGVGFLVLSMFVSACSDGATDTAAPEAPVTTEAAPTTAAITTTAATTTTQPTATTTAPTTTQPTATTTAATTTTQPTATTAAPTTTTIRATTISGLPDGVVIGCGSFESQQQAQDWFEANQDFGEGVDGNGDEIGRASCRERV